MTASAIPPQQQHPKNQDLTWSRTRMVMGSAPPSGALESPPSSADMLIDICFVGFVG